MERRQINKKMVCFFIFLISLSIFTTRTGTEASDSEDILLMLPAILGKARYPSVTTIIGSGGGAINQGDTQVTFPPGALSSEAQIILKTIKPPLYFGNQDDPVYRIEVDSEYICQPLTVEIKNYGGVDRTIFVALSDSVIGDPAVSNTTYPGLVDGTVKDGILTFQLPATEECSDSQSTREALQTKIGSGFNFWAISGYLSSVSSHFRVNYPSAILGQGGDRPEIILNTAEQAYTLIKNLGFSFDSQISWPVDINVCYRMTDSGETAIPLTGKRNQYINIKSDLCLTDETDSLKSTVGHEVFHVVQNIYIPRTGLLIRHTWATPYFYWLSEASSTWFENIILASETWVPTPFTENYGYMPKGLETYIKEERPHSAASSRGYWASGYLRYLVDRAGRNEFVFDLWENVRNQKSGAYSDLTALIDTLGSSLQAEITWADFIGKFASGNTGYTNWILPSFNANFFDYSHEVKDFSADLEPFSAVKWGIQFKCESGCDEDYQVLITSMPNSNLSFFLYRRDNPNDPFTKVTDLKNNQGYIITPNAGDVFTVIVTNTDTDAPYQTPVTASMRVARNDKCRYCQGVPDYAMMTKTCNYGRCSLYWKHPTEGYIYAIETYTDETLMQIDSANCRDDQGVCLFEKSWNQVADYENPSTVGDWYFWNYSPYDSNCRLHGIYLQYWYDGSPSTKAGFEHGLNHGIYESYNAPKFDNNLAEKGNYENGGKVGIWYYYKLTGELNHTCTWDGQYYPVECHCADENNCEPMNY